MIIKLDLKYKKILYQLDINSRQSSSQIAKKVGLSKEVVNYRINKLLKNNIINYFYVVLNTLAIGYSHYKIYFKFQNTDFEKEEEIIKYFQSYKNCIWIGACGGGWDLGLSLLAKGPKNFGELFQGIIEKYGLYFLEKNILLIESAPTFNKAYLLDKSESIELKYSETENPRTIDDVDKNILSKISINARMPIYELSKKLNLSRNIIFYRLKKMRKKGIIQGYRPSINLESIEYKYYKILMTFKNTNLKKEKMLIAYCRLHPNITQYIKLIGSWDAEIEVEITEDIKLRKLIMEIKYTFSDIIRNMEQLRVYEKKLNYCPF